VKMLPRTMNIKISICFIDKVTYGEDAAIFHACEYLTIDKMKQCYIIYHLRPLSPTLTQ